MANLVRGTAFITGAGSGIGQATAQALAKHGVKRLALCDIRPEALKDTNDRLRANHQDIKVLNVEMDTSREDSVKSAINQNVQAFDRIDIAINNAGIGGTPKPSHEKTLHDFQKVVSINLNGVWLCQRYQILQMLNQDPLSPAPRGNRGIIVNVASMLGLVASSPGTPVCAYTATKHAVMGLTKTDAVAYAKDGIRINAICPGYIATPLLKSATAPGVMNEEVMKVPMCRLGEMEEIADAITFLSSEMSSFMCGSGLVVDGGYTAQ